MQKTLTYSSFATASLIVALVFMTSTSYEQLGVGIALYPLLVFFGLKAFPRKTWKASAQPIRTSANATQEVKTEAVESPISRVEVSDINKRAFLKLIGGFGLSFFLFSLFSKKAFGQSIGATSSPTTTSFENADGMKINPAENQPTDGYRITEIDDNDITFYGFVNKDGGWFIMKEDMESSFRYARGDSNFKKSWDSREGLKYQYFHDAF